jgi:hypothetical protein
MKSLTLAALAAFTIAAPAFAADPAPTAPADKAAKPAKAKPKPEGKLICYREEDTGSFLAKRVCKTQEQIDEDRRNAQLLEDQRQLLGDRGGVGGPGR